MEPAQDLLEFLEVMVTVDLAVDDRVRCLNLDRGRSFHHAHNRFLDNAHDHIHSRILDLDCVHGGHDCVVHARVHGGVHDCLVGNLHVAVDVQTVEVVHAIEEVHEAKDVREAVEAHVAEEDIRMAGQGVQQLVVAHKHLAYSPDNRC